ncbi:MAG: bifunctional folylpolyglutamate synthase/dihydrofolate synthase [Planctomycetes bacterium]|nr:bifunctional folylpolyglutamate synthase/dihydrofolate synthase [Planctomycetota bacterium]
MTTGASGGQTVQIPSIGPPRRAIANYQSALKYLNSHINIERMRTDRIDRSMLTLDRMKALLGALGNPHRDVRCVHVAGSKGKGSTVEMTASCLEGCGYAVGIYTSPHLVHIRERIRVNNSPIAHARFTQGMVGVAAAADSIEADHGKPTYFEVLTALALVHFADQAVDIAIIETGLGGRLDSTNVVQPEVTAITAIQLEHVELLGTTLEAIAAEKAGIFKPGIAALSVPQTAGVEAVLREKAEEAGTELQMLGKEIDFSYRFEANVELGPHARVSLTTERSEYEHLPVPLKGEHQAHNCGLALAILDQLRDRGYETPERAVLLGLANTPANGRMDLVWKDPRIIIDGAHNPESIKALVKAIGAHMKYDSMVVIFGCAEDKDVDGMLHMLALGADKILFTRSSDNPRAIDPKELQRRFAEISPKMTQVVPKLKEAINTAHKAIGRDDLICVTGSFYLAGEAKKMLQDAKAKAKRSKAKR